ncbi:hypothetical protein [Bradyrhizobium sp. WSM2254]|uniref:hypothetical protein n=1 Tax=Bradyrhizobium sp. WSM2254 TaxID=1188263 RepID=UPI0012EC87DC|nr:hypothetical protein [Bradyrhizobium sp. WSM2254]
MGVNFRGATFNSAGGQDPLADVGDQKRSQQCADAEAAVGVNVGGGRGGGGNSGGGGANSSDGPSGGWLDWNMARETSRTSDGSRLTVVTVGYQGYTLSVHHPTLGDAHITGHADGTQHRHEYMSDDPQRGDKVRSNLGYSGGLDIIGKPNPRG